MSDSTYGMFEALAGSDTEQEREQRIAANKLAAATYDVRERFGGFLSGARDVNDFNDRVALCKDDMIKVVEPHLFPRTGVMRRICKQLKDEWKTAAGGQPQPVDPQLPGINAPSTASWPINSGMVPDVPPTTGGAPVGQEPVNINAARRRTADDKVMDVDVTYRPDDGPMVPAGDFHAYQDRVDQDGPGKVDANVFLGEGVQHTGDPADTLFVKGKEAVRHFALWCQARGVKPSLDSLERYSSRGLSDTNYFTIAAALQRSAKGHVDRNGNEWAEGFTPDEDDVRARAKLKDPQSGELSPGESWGGPHHGSSRTAAPDYLQKADQALSDLLNQRAEEFQTTIAPLQQALQVVQQAEAEQQAANPFNVMPGGSINVMPGAPGGDPAAGGGDPAAGGDPMGAPPMDPSMGGGAPPMDPSMGADPSMGGGMPPADPMGGDPSGGEMPQDLQRQMMMQSKRGGHPKAEARLAGDNVRVADVVKAWEEWNAKKPQSGGLPTGGEVDYDNFARETGAGNRAIQKLKNHLQAPVVAARKEAGVEDYQGHKIKIKKVKDRAGTPGTEVHVNGHYHWTYPDHQGGPENAVKMTKRTIDDSVERPDAYEWSRKQGALHKEAWMGWGGSQLGAHRVAGFDWDDYLNGYIAHAPGKFACVCGTEVAVPSGFQRCACGKQWNSYVIGTGGDRHEASAEKYLVREIPTRDNVIVASKDDEDWDEDDPDEILKHSPRQQEHNKQRGQDIALSKELFGSRSFAEFLAEAYAAREAAIYKLTEPGELGEGEDDGTATMKQQPEDWAARNADGKFNSTRKRRSL